MLSLLLVPGTASACRYLVTPPKIDGEFQAIVIADIDVARDTGQTGFWVWEIEAHVTGIVAGRADTASYGFRYITGSNGCSPAPPVGRFVLYITDTAHGERVTQSLPLEEAMAADPRVASFFAAR